MTRSTEDHSGPSCPWRVRLRDARTRTVLGAGVLVDERQVLTCAHVLADDPSVAAPPRLAVLAELVGVPGQPAVPVRPVATDWIPSGADFGGDLAVIELGTPQPARYAAPLHRLPPTPHLPVRVCGFPAGVENGLWARGTLGGPAGPRGEWIQIDPVQGHPTVEPGFSGAGVEHLGGAVIGMVVTRTWHGGHQLSYLLPIESIVGHLPRLSRLVHGSPAIDAALAPPAVPPAAGAADAFTRQMTEWFAGGGTPRVWMVVVGDLADARSSVLRRTLELSDRERPGRRDAAGPSPEGAVPPLGSVDVAVDASGRTVEDVRDRIVGRLRAPGGDDVPPEHWLRSSAPPARLVVDGLDDAVRPTEMVSDLVGPLVDRGSRVLLALRRPPTPALRAAVSAIAVPSDESLRTRLDGLLARVAELDAAERAVEALAGTVRRSRVLPVPAVPDRATRLRLALTGLRRDTGRPAVDTAADLDTVQQALDRAGRRLGKVRAELDRLADSAREVVELRGLLDAYAARVTDAGIAEDEALGAAYRSAYALVWAYPGDVPAARAGVLAYVDSARGRLAERTARDRRL